MSHIRLQESDGSAITYSHDLNGNRSSKTEVGVTTSHAYDFENHLTQISTPSTTVGQYAYSGDGLRVGKTSAAGTIDFVYDGQRLLQETDAGGETTATYTSKGGSVYHALVSDHRGGASRFPFLDAMGSIRILLDNGQNFTDGYANDGFGNQVSGGGTSPNPYRYAGAFGYYSDAETGLQLLTARYYDPIAGRFMTRDPIGFGGRDVNLYGYVRNRPSDRRDSMGLDWLDDLVNTIDGAGAIHDLIKDIRENKDPSDNLTDNAFAKLMSVMVSTGGSGAGVAGGGGYLAYLPIFQWLMRKLPESMKDRAKCDTCIGASYTRPRTHCKGGAQNRPGLRWDFDGLSCFEDDISGKVTVGNDSLLCQMDGANQGDDNS